MYLKDSRDLDLKQKLEIWPQRPRYFAATIAIHRGEQGGGMSEEGGTSVKGGGTSVVMGGMSVVMGRWHISWGGGVDFGPYLVDGSWGEASMGRGGQP